MANAPVWFRASTPPRMAYTFMFREWQEAAPHTARQEEERVANKGQEPHAIHEWHHETNERKEAGPRAYDRWPEMTDTAENFHKRQEVHLGRLPDGSGEGYVRVSALVNRSDQDYGNEDTGFSGVVNDSHSAAISLRARGRFCCSRDPGRVGRGGSLRRR
jgi:hypothetical protein